MQRLFAAMLPMVLAAAAHGQVIISEIMFNPSSDEKLPNLVEWVEIVNLGDKDVKIADYFLQDEDGKTGTIGGDATLKPGQVAVLIPAEQSVENFKAAWGDDILVFPLTTWGKDGMTGLSNDPGGDNEHLQLMKSPSDAADAVFYDDEGDWPLDDPQGPSIHLKPGSFDATANDDGKNWARSEEGKLGAKKSKAEGGYNGRDVGSPGVVVRTSEYEGG